jgi:hypothetical protein
MNKASNHHMSPLKGIFNLQVQYGFSHNYLDSRDGFQGLANGHRRKIRPLGPI